MATLKHSERQLAEIAIQSMILILMVMVMLMVMTVMLMIMNKGRHQNKSGKIVVINQTRVGWGFKRVKSGLKWLKNDQKTKLGGGGGSFLFLYLHAADVLFFHTGHTSCLNTKVHIQGRRWDDTDPVGGFRGQLGGTETARWQRVGLW